jgi:hypothetical protein
MDLKARNSLNCSNETRNRFSSSFLVRRLMLESVSGCRNGVKTVEDLVERNDGVLVEVHYLVHAILQDLSKQSMMT